MLGVKDLKLIANRLMGKEKFADKVLKGGNVINVITREIYEADIAIRGNYILMVGDCVDLIGKETEDDKLTLFFSTGISCLLLDDVLLRYGLM